jgi:hypothetical protein
VHCRVRSPLILCEFMKDVEDRLLRYLNDKLPEEMWMKIPSQALREIVVCAGRFIEAERTRVLVDFTNDIVKYGPKITKEKWSEVAKSVDEVSDSIKGIENSSFLDELERIK